MTEAERQEILDTLKDYICFDPNVMFGPVTEDRSPDQPGIWIQIDEFRAYLGASYQAAMFTSKRSDWWIPTRDGNMLDDDREWFETRATLGDDWERHELPMFKEERRIRLVHNIHIATTDEIDDEREH